MRAGSWISAGVLAVVTVLSAGYLALGVVRIDPLVRYDSLNMTLPRAAGIAERSPVLLRGVRVGDVTAVRLASGNGVDIALRVRDSYRIPVGSELRIENLSALGEPYIEFVPAADRGPYLRDGQRIDTSAVRLPHSIPDGMRALTELVGELDPNAVRSLVTTFDQAFAGTEAVVPQLSRSTQLLAATLMSRMPVIEELLRNAQTMGSNMDWAGPSAAAAADPWDLYGVRVQQVVDAVSRLANAGDTPEMYLHGSGLVPVLTRLTDWLHDAAPELKALVPALSPLAAGAAAAVPQLDLGALITQALGAVGDDGAVHLRIDTK
ncbi:MlaD family protein [Nocardia nova]|uniref:MlaD family protein n=1 Tax=Nocardia nova TaxID=37330 RepID=UPI003410FDD0